METIKIAVCDDEQYIRSHLISLIQKQNYDSEITEYASAEAYLSAAAEYDLLFLDIELGDSCPEHTAVPGGQSLSAPEKQPDHAEPGAPASASRAGAIGQDALSPHLRTPISESPMPTPENRINGMELARRIRAAADSPQPLIIFVTGHESYVYDAFDVDAFQYLLKPVDGHRFAEVFRRAAAHIASAAQQRQKKLAIQYAGTSKVLPLSDIYYMESQGHKVVLHLKDTALEYYARLGELERNLQGQFSRIHKGFLVNLAYVEEYSRSTVTLANGDKLNLSKYKYDDFVKAHLRFMKSSV